MMGPTSPRPLLELRESVHLSLILSVVLVFASVFAPWFEWQHTELSTQIFGDLRENTNLISLLPVGNAGTKDFVAAPRP